MITTAEQLDLADIQGIAMSGYGHLPRVAYLVLQVTDARAARRWLAAMASEITSASGKDDASSTNLAISYPGLKAIGLDARTLSTFPYPFRQGMQNRFDILGDAGGNAPDRWLWGGPKTPEIHALLLVFAPDEAQLDALVKQRQSELAAGGLEVVLNLEARLYPDLREHFGFKDGISQPVIAGSRAQEKVQAGDPPLVQPGDFLLGYTDAYGTQAVGAVLMPALDPKNILPPVTIPLTTTVAHHLGANGTYLVFRQLAQHVATFWQFMDRATRLPDGLTDPKAQELLAAKFLGRWTSGAPLVLSPDTDNPALANANNFTFAGPDPNGFACPMGAHIRRGYPRDALPPDPAEATVTTTRHRLLRRGRHYGPRPEDRYVDDGIERGLHFISLNSEIDRQFELIQQTWINNPVFNSLFEEFDPLVGVGKAPANMLTIQADPVRKRMTKLPEFITLRGGGYFFVPGLAALRYLGSLSDV